MSASVGEGAEEPKPMELASIDPANLPSPSNPLLAIRLKELEFKMSRQQYQSQLLQVRAVELETQRAIRLKELDLGLKAQQPAHFPAAEAPSVNVPVSAPVNASTPSPVPAPRSPFQCFPQQYAGNSCGIYMLMYLYILPINIHRGRCPIDAPVVVHSVDGEVLPRRDTNLYNGMSMTENITNVRLIGPEEPLIEGESANITSDGAGNITSVQWMKDNSPLSPSNSIIFSSDNRLVSISPVQRSDSGEYQCTYINPVSSETAKLSLIINYGPDDVSIQGEDVVDLGVPVSLSCSADSEPSASFSWKFNGSDTGVTTDTFIIDQTDFTHSGDYECIALNSVTKKSGTRNHPLLVKGAQPRPNQDAEVNYADISHFQKSSGERVNLGNSDTTTQYAEIKHGGKSKAPPPPYGSQMSK
ncbi:carcinoembryonic antigen-related cell adhesion molecule 20-like protein [Labeo rohita]|uniref:Carcinoembryonic antigen-related cell adhesion molecule 20-like protein n=1 Tax=Labeo rohita TaxID=84645 RepID=A0A498NE76_LABRO|nr:carcinoembryonic antigen-related cell adhesion molecule 20-like protein [Labeo rohita]